MQNRDIEQLDLLAQIDDLTARTRAWSEREVNWKPCGRAHALVRRVLGRVESMRVRFDAPLIVAMFGGTGTGKSTLVNALFGQEITESGKRRPTTKKPILIVHREQDISQLGFDLGDYEITRFGGEELRDIVLIDCPDPDTSETEAAGSNLAQLRSVVPHCDVLIFAATQQKYRSQRVISELAEAASGCRLIFVQTHADRDADIREDWERHLAGFEVPTMFFIDSVGALEARRAGERPSGDFARLLEVLDSELAAGARTSVRRANVLDLLGQTLRHCQGLLEEARPAVLVLEEQLAQERDRLTGELSKNLTDDLLSSRHLWERRILTTVTEYWGMSPFSTLLRLYNGLGGVLASMTVYRARSAAQIALVGAAEGARRLRAWSEEREASDRGVRMDNLSIDDAQLRGSRVVIAGYADEAGISAGRDERNLDELHAAAAVMEQNFLGNARQQIDGVIREIAAKNSRWSVRIWYEFLLSGYLLFIVWRIAKNFFWDSFLRPMWLPDAEAAALLPMEFYVSAGVFLLLWAGLLVVAYTRRLQRGLARKIRGIADALSSQHLSGGLFPRYEADCRRIDAHVDELRGLTVSIGMAQADSCSEGRLGHLRVGDGDL